MIRASKQMANNRETKMATEKANTRTMHIICNKSYGIYYGRIVEHNAASGVCIVEDCRHVCLWYGRTGGITSLAAHGLCGPRAGESLIGAPVKGRSTLTGIVNVFPCSPEAAATIDAAIVR